jgi:hypothetical protein
MGSEVHREVRALRNSLPWMIASGMLVLLGVALSLLVEGQQLLPIMVFGAAPVSALIGYLVLRRGVGKEQRD